MWFFRKEKWTKVREKMGFVRIYNDIGTVDRLEQMLVILEKSDKGRYRAHAEDSEGKIWKLAANFVRVDFFGMDENG